MPNFEKPKQKPDEELIDEKMEKSREIMKIKQAEQAIESLQNFFDNAPEEDKIKIEEKLEKIKKQRESQI